MTQEDEGRLAFEKVLNSPLSAAKTDTMTPVLYSKIRDTIEPDRFGLPWKKLCRLAGLRQLGILPDPIHVEKSENGSKRLSHHPDIQVYEHRRLTHSLLAGWNMFLAVGELGEGKESVLAGLIAALHHDIGHAALSHVGDMCLDWTIRTTHEERSAQLIKTSLSRDLKLGELVSQIIHEQSGLGQVLGIIDTDAYLRVDSIEAGLCLDLPNIMELMGNDIKLNANGILLVSSKGRDALIQLLNQRRKAYGLLYNHPWSLILEEMHRRGLQYALEKGVITLGDLQDGTDDQIYAKLLLFAIHNPEAGSWFAGLTADKSRLYRPMSQNEQKNNKHKNRESITVEPTNIGGKKLEVIYNGKSITLRATDTQKYHPWQGQTLTCVAPE